jgi:outer membrane protein insertion porin family
LWAFGRPQVFENELQAAYEADRIGYIVEGLKTAANGLVALDIFDAIDLKLDKGAESLGSPRGATGD